MKQKLDTLCTMNGLRKPLKKILLEKPQKGKTDDIAALERKITIEKATFCSNAVFLLYSKLYGQNVTSQNHTTRIFVSRPVSA